MNAHELLDGFTEPCVFDGDHLRGAPDEPGVHIVYGADSDEIVFVGHSAKLRSRMRQHLSGDRDASVLYEQVGELLDGDRPESADRDAIQAWLAKCRISWKVDNDRVQLKRKLIGEFSPTFNRLRIAPDQEEANRMEAGWEGFVHWARRMAETFDLAEQERNYKVTIGEQLDEARVALASGGPWFEPLRRTVRDNENNLLVWRVKPKFLKWVEQSPYDASAALEAVWDESQSHEDAVAAFCELFPVEVVSGAGTRAGLASLLRMGVSATECPVVRPQAFATAYKLTGFDASEQRDERSQFRDGIVFCDRFISEGSERGLEIQDRLDAQSLLWMVTNYEPPASWPEAERAAFRSFRAGEPANDEDPMAALVRRFRRETGYPSDGNPQRERERGELAEGLTPSALDEPDLDVLRRLAGPAYGSPGPQPGFNRLLQDEETAVRLVNSLRELLYGADEITVRIENAMEGPAALPGFKQAMVTKALAVVDPDRWIPNYVTTGDVGKRAVLPLLGLPLAPKEASLAAEMVDSNDRIRERLDEFFPDDPWGMQEFSWWLLHLDEAPEDDGIEALAREVTFPRDFIEKTLRLIGHKKQVVFYGPPGTGKTFYARALAKHLARGGGSVDVVQFHPSYSYEDFVEGFRPKTVDGQLSYEVVDGPLKRIAQKALARPDVTHVLVIDEFNRALVSKVLGELYFLLEYRDTELRLQYSETPFTLPKNLVLIATMNTADRSIALVDAALRRRFHFIGFYPDQPPVDRLLRTFLRDHKLDGLSWLPDAIDAANGLVADRHLALGPSHFLDVQLTEAQVEMIWEHSVMPYFEEQFLDDPEQLRQFELDSIRSRLTARGTGVQAEDDPNMSDETTAAD
ncbi:MAG TPA: hypothetical protein DCS55_00175 [Acidimicrobiaceae bacterium]|nr:hypothetical protein [Acidimicrobiaceae bacterium]